MTAPVNRGWLAVHIIVASGLLSAAVALQTLVVGTVIPPLLIVAVIALVGLVLLTIRPRPAALLIGGTAALFLVASAFNVSAVVQNLTTPANSAEFLATATLQIANVAGTAGLVGVIAGWSDRVARMVLAGIGVAALLAATVSVVAGG